MNIGDIFKNIIKSCHVSNSEIRGVIILLVVIFLMLLSKIAYFKYREHRLNEIAFDDKTLQSYYEKLINQSRHDNIIVNNVDINIATRQEIMKIGIRKVIAKRITKYRDSLGGFVNTKQLREVYDISTKELNLLSKYATIDRNFTPKKISISPENFKRLSHHPYLDDKRTKNLLSFVKYHPGIHISDLIKQGIITQKVAPYLSMHQPEIIIS